MKNVPKSQKAKAALPVPDPLDEKRWGKATVLAAGQKLADTELREGRVFYPAFPDIDGGSISIAAVTEVIQRLLQQAGCHTDGTQVMRHTAASIALNEWGASVKDVCQIFHWETEQLVWQRYARQQEESVFSKFDALTESAYALPSDAARVVRETALALASLLEDACREDGDKLVQVHTALVLAVDALRALDPTLPKLADVTLLAPDERATVDAFIREKTDRHQDLERLLGRRVIPGIQCPRPQDPSDEPDSSARPRAA